jgi:hypothetical protein
MIRNEMIRNELMRNEMIRNEMVRNEMIRNEEGRWMKDRKESMQASQNQMVHKMVIAK